MDEQKLKDGYNAANERVQRGVQAVASGRFSLLIVVIIVLAIMVGTYLLVK